MKFFLIILITIPYLVLSGCSISGFLDDSLENFQTVLQESENARLMDRGLPTFIITLDTLLYNDKDSIALLRKAAQLHVSYALSFVESQDIYSASLHYAQAKEYMTRIFLEEYEWDINKIIGKSEQKLIHKLQQIEKDEAPDLFWLAMSWGLWINTKRDDAAALAQFPYIRVMMEHTLKLIPEYQNGLPHLFFGVYYGSGTKALGGDPEKGKYHFDKIIEMTQGEFLLPKVLCAKTYCCSVQNRKMFQQLLTEVINATPSQNKEFTLSNSMAKKQAQELLDKIDEYFIPETPTSNEIEVEIPNTSEDIW